MNGSPKDHQEPAPKRTIIFAAQTLDFVHEPDLSS